MNEAERDINGDVGGGASEEPEATEPASPAATNSEDQSVERVKKAFEKPNKKKRKTADPDPAV